MISICPTNTRIVKITHLKWNLHWDLQFPEIIVSQNGVSLMWQSIFPEWIQISDKSWYYEWQTTNKYINEQNLNPQQDFSGNIIRHNFVLGLALKAEIEAFESEIALSLTISNGTTNTFKDVLSDGGCLRARSSDFMNHEEVKRSFVIKDSRLISMSELHRTGSLRCLYRSDIKDYDKDWINPSDWFWGRSNDKIDRPAIVGAVAGDGSKAIVIGYQSSFSASQNAEYHCLHSEPSFGDISPDSAITRKGYILFGKDLDILAEQLRQRIP